jgi:hypothetical protein
MFGILLTNQIANRASIFKLALPEYVIAKDLLELRPHRR